MAKRAKKSNNYFTKITELAIIGYNKTDSPVKREKIYRRFIYPAFMKLAENTINKIKPDYIDSTFGDLQTDLVTHLTQGLSKFNAEHGKAYSYYTRSSFNYLIGENDKAYKKLKKDSIELDIDEQRNVIIEEHNSEMRETLKDFMDAYIDYCYNNLNYIFTNQSDIHVADSLLHIFSSRESIEDFNKKALYIYIREIIDVKTPKITKIANRLYDIFKEGYVFYLENGYTKF